MQTRYLRALIAVLFVSGVAGATFFVSSRLSTSQNVAPNAPDSEPQAFTGNIHNGIRLPDEDIRDIKNGTSGNTSTPPRNPTRTIMSDDEYEATQRPPATTPKPTTTPLSGRNDEKNYGSTPTPSKTPAPSNKPAATPTIAENRYGYRPPDSEDPSLPAYMRKEANQCDDNLYFIAGTGCDKDGNRFVLKLKDTLAAHDAAVKQAKEQIANKSDEELLKIAAEQKVGSNCGSTDYTCQQNNIELITKKLLVDNAVVITKDIEEIRNAQKVNQVTNDAFLYDSETFGAKYGTTNKQAKLTSMGVSMDTAKLIVSNHNLLEKFQDPNKYPDTVLRTEYCAKNPQIPDCRNEFKRTDYLNDLTVNPEYKNNLINSYKQSAKDTEISNKYLSSASDTELAKEYCGKAANQSACQRNFEREDLLINNPEKDKIIQLKKDNSTQWIISNPSNDLNDLAKIYCGGKTSECTPNRILSEIKNEEIKQKASDQLLFNLYVDVKNSPSDLAKVYCSSQAQNQQRCQETFQPDTFLTQIKDPNVKQFAQTNRNTALSNLIPLVVQGKPVPGIDTDTKREVVKLNEQTTQAYWVFLKENRGRQLQGVTSEQLALEFDKLLKENPTLLSQKLALYNQNPSLYKLPTAIKFDQEENPLIIAQYNQITKTQSVPGLAVDGKAVAWSDADPLYKLKAMSQACQSGGSVLTSNECRSVTGTLNKLDNINNPSDEDKKIIASFANTVLADKFGNTNKSQAYLQEVFNNDIGGVLLTVNQSNLATVDNTSTDPTLKAEIEKAKLSAENKEAENILFNPKYGFGNMSGTSISVPVSVRDQLPEPQKLTDQQKTDLANEYLRRQLVVETYTRGTGVAGALASAAIATSICSGAGGLAVGCGVAGGIAGVVSNFIPILGSATAEEIEAERQKIASFIGNDSAATFIQAMYSNQGAASDESIIGGRSQSNLDNQYALLEKIHDINYQYGTTVDSLSNTDYQAEIALQPFLLQQGELLQKENADQALVNLIVSPIVGAISAGVGGNIVNQAAQTGTSLLKDVAIDTALWAGGSLINVAQTQAQFQSTVNYVDTQEEITYTSCVRKFGASFCDTQSQAVVDANIQANLDTQYQAFITDAIIQAGQTGTTVSLELGNRAAQMIRGPQTPQSPAPTTNSGLSTAINNLISSSKPVGSNTTPRPSSTLNSGTVEALNYIAQNGNLNNPPTGIDNVDTSIASMAYNNREFIDYLNSPTEPNLRRLGRAIQEAENSPYFGGNSGPDIQNAYIEALIIANQNIINRTPQELITLLRPVRVELGMDQAHITNASIPIDTTSATVIDTKTDALKAIINEESKRNVPLTPEETTRILTELEFQNEDIQYVLNLRQTDANDQVLYAIEQLRGFDTRAEAAKADAGDTEILRESLQRVRTDLLSEVTTEIQAKQPTNQSAQQAKTPLTLEDISGLPPEFLNGLTLTQRTELNNLVNAINNANTTPRQQEVFRNVLKEQINSFINGETDIRLLTTKIAPETPIVTYENTINLPREAFTAQQLTEIDIIIKSINEADTVVARDSLTKALTQIADNYKSTSGSTPPNITQNTDSLTQVLPNLTRDQIQEQINTLRGQRALNRINNNNQTATEISPGRIVYTKRGSQPNKLNLFDIPSANSLDNQIYVYAKSIGIEPSGKSMPEIIALIKEKNNSTAQAPSDTQPDIAPLPTTMPDTPVPTTKPTVKQPVQTQTKTLKQVISDLLKSSERTGGRKGISEAGHVLLLDRQEINYTTTPDGAKIKITKNKIGGLFTITEDHEWISINQKGEIVKHLQTKIAGIPVGKEVVTNTHTLSNRSEDLSNYYYQLQTIEEKYNDITKINREKGDQSYNKYNDAKYNLEIHNLQNKYANETGLVFINEDYLIAQYKKNVSEIQKTLQETNSSNKEYSLLDDTLYQEEIIKLQDSYKRQGLVFKDSENRLNRHTDNLYPEAADPADRAGLFTNILNLTPSDQADYKYIAQEMHAMNSGTFKPQKSPEALDYVDALIYATARYQQDKVKIKTEMKNLGYKERDIDQAIRTIKNPKYLSSEIISIVETIENKLYDRNGQFGTTFRTKERITESTITNSITEYAKKQMINPVTPLKTNYDGKLIVTDERFPGVTFISGANGQNEISTKDIRSLPASLNEQLKSKYTPKEIEELSGQITNEKFRINQDKSYSKPITDILDIAKKHNISINNRTLDEISIDVRTAENQIDRKIGQLAPLSESERRYSVKSIPPILAEKILEIHDFDPNATIHKVEFNNFRYWSLDYFDSNPNWVEFTQNIRSNESIPSPQKEKIIQAAREHLTDHINMSLRSSNPDIITYPKGNTKYTLDLHPNRENSFAIMKKFLSEDLISDTKAAVTELNNTINNGGNIKNVQVDPSWGVKNLDLKDFKAGDIITLTVSKDPNLPVIATFVDNGIYFDFQGDNNEVYTGVFGYQLKKSIPDLSPDFPVIEQTSINDPDQKTITIEGKGNIKITGKKKDPTFVSDTPQTTTYRQAVTADEVNHLANYHSDSSTTAEALYASLTPDEKQTLNDGKIVDVYITNSTEATINKVTHVSGDLAGSSPMTATVLRVASEMTDRSMALRLLNGAADMQDVYLQELSKRLTNKAGFKKYETAGDGLRGFKTDSLTAETVSELTDISSIYQDVFTECLSGKHGENAKLAADTVVSELGDNSVDFKLAISTGDVKFTFLPGKDSFSLEIKPSGNTDVYLENVKKYINILKDRKETPPKNIIGISEDIYEALVSTNQLEKLSSFGKKVIIENIPGYGDAYFVVKNEFVTSPNDKLLNPSKPLNSMLLPPIQDLIPNLFGAPQQTKIVNRNSPITIRNIELIISPEKNQQFIDSIDTTDQFNSRYNKATIYYDKNGQIVGFGDMSKLHPKTQESILNGQHFKTTILIPKDDTKKYTITEVQETKNVVAHKIITETIELLNNRDTAIALLAQTGKIDIVENTRIQLRKYVSKLLGVVAGILIENNFGEKISQGINSFFNMSMSSGTLAPTDTQNQQDFPISLSPTATITPTQTQYKAPIENFNFNDKGYSSEPIKGMIVISNALISCQNQFGSGTGNRGQKIAECFCNSFTESCNDSEDLKNISLAITNIFDQNISQKSIIELYFLLTTGNSQIISTVSTQNLNQNQNKTIINDFSNEPLFSECSVEDISSPDKGLMANGINSTGPLIGDIIEIGNQNQQYICLQTSTKIEGDKSISVCQVLAKDKVGNISLVSLDYKSDYIVYRSSKYKNSSCWSN